MLRRFIIALLATLIAGCIVVSGAFATGSGSDKTTARATANALTMLSAVKSVRIGMNSATITIQNGAKSHPIVIDYGEALKTGKLVGTNIGSTSKLANGSTSTGSGSGSLLPASFSLGQIAAWLLGLTLVSRVVGIVRQVVPHRS